MDDPNMHAYGEGGPDDAEIGRQWREDSSLEKWFPLTAERLAAKERELSIAHMALTAIRSPRVHAGRTGADERGIPGQAGYLRGRTQR